MKREMEMEMKIAMDEKYIQSPTQKMIEPPHLTKKLIPLLLCSLSMFSVMMIWYSSRSSGSSILPPYFSVTFPVAATNSIDRKFVFLVFNGLLVFIAKTSRLTYNSSTSTSQSCASGTNSYEQSHDESDVADAHQSQISDWVIVEEQDENEEVKEDDDGAGDELSAEELNKKCDEFIRRMKEGIRIEAQEQVEPLLPAS
uniref:DUF4408 domain-containing protein n=1 Tax=Kalanchoe fedtschenkoi TaxID=63787 RepID=A0A7N0SW34_KALFE